MLFDAIFQAVCYIYTFTMIFFVARLTTTTTTRVLEFFGVSEKLKFQVFEESSLKLGAWHDAT